mgnify:CR=1 FL=1
MNLDSKEIARYLGSRGADLWPEAAALAADCQRELEGTVTPRTLGRRLSLSLFAGQSRDLDHHLRHCTEGILFAVTLGAETDRLLRRWSAQSMAKAAVGQAVCAVWLDQLCADYCDSFLPTLDEGQYLTPAFSPGYGDVPLAMQTDIFRVLDCSRKIGLTLNESLLMSPSKSVTAIFGVTDRAGEDCAGAGCAACGKQDCAYRE